MMVTYLCADYLNYEERERFNVVPGGFDRNVRVVATDEFRPPRAGEWYLSGARIAGYKAPNDLTSAYWIARLVRTKTMTTTVTTIVE